MRKTMLAALALCLAPTLALAAKPNERWARYPSRAELVAALPPAMQGGALDGRAAMICKLTAKHRLADCRLVRESPAGRGYGAALLSLASTFELSAQAARPLRPGDDVDVSEDWFDFDTPANWRRKPTSDQLLAVWPTKAWSQGLGGKAVINCVAGTQGALTDCMVVSESPPGQHFGDAAVALTPQFLMTPALRHGVPVPSSVSIPINFAWPGGSPRGEPQSSFGSRATMSPSQAWVEAPSYAEVAAAYPPAARAQHLGGHVALNCDLRKDGRLGSCSVIAEEPRGLGFGQAARTLAKQFRGQQRPTGGALSGVQLPVTFDPAMLAGGPPVVGKPQWVTLPTGDALSKAFATVKGGSTTLGCTVQPGGALDGCIIESERPAGTGLGAAALSLAPSFRLSTWTNEGLATVGAHVSIPLRYDLKETAAAPALPAAKP